MKHFRIKPLFFAAALFISLFLVENTNIEAVEPNWIITDKGCKVWNPNPQPNESVTWSGECVDGKANGNGILTWYKNRIEFSRNIMTTKNGNLMVNGILTGKVEPSSVVFSIFECNKIFSYRGIVGVVDKEIDLSRHHVALHILEKAAQFAREVCPMKDNFSNIDVVLYQGDIKEFREYEYKQGAKHPSDSYKRMDEKYKDEVVQARNYDKDKLTWSEYNNKPLQKRRSEEKAKYDAIVKTLQEEKSRREMEARRAEAELKMEARRAEEERKKQEIRKRYNEFVKKNGVQAWPSGNELSANPFVYEGKTVAIKAEFKEMLTPTQGIFDGFVVSNIPKGLFTARGTDVVLAGRVIGKTEVKMGLEMSVPHLKFVGVHFCKNYDCSDILP